MALPEAEAAEAAAAAQEQRLERARTARDFASNNGRDDDVTLIDDLIRELEVATGKRAAPDPAMHVGKSGPALSREERIEKIGALESQQLAQGPTPTESRGWLANNDPEIFESSRLAEMRKSEAEMGYGALNPMTPREMQAQSEVQAYERDQQIPTAPNKIQQQWRTASVVGPADQRPEKLLPGDRLIVDPETGQPRKAARTPETLAERRVTERKASDSKVAIKTGTQSFIANRLASQDQSIEERKMTQRLIFEQLSPDEQKRIKGKFPEQEDMGDVDQNKFLFAVEENKDNDEVLAGISGDERWQTFKERMKRLGNAALSIRQPYPGFSKAVNTFGAEDPQGDIFGIESNLGKGGRGEIDHAAIRELEGELADAQADGDERAVANIRNEIMELQDVPETGVYAGESRAPLYPGASEHMREYMAERNSINFYENVIQPAFKAEDEEGKEIMPGDRLSAYVDRIRAEQYSPEAQEKKKKRFVAEDADWYNPFSWGDGNTALPWEDWDAFMLHVFENTPQIAIGIISARLGGRGAGSLAGWVHRGQKLSRIETMRRRAAGIGGAIAGGGTEGLLIHDAVKSQVNEAMDELPNEAFENYPYYLSLIDHGMPDVVARQVVQNEVSRLAGKTGFVVSGVMMGAPMGYVFGQRAAGRIGTALQKEGALQTTGRIAAAGGGEMLQEGTQEVSEDVITNIHMRAVDPDRPIFDDVFNTFMGGALISFGPGAFGGIERDPVGYSKEDKAAMDATQDYVEAANRRYAFEAAISSPQYIEKVSPQQRLQDYKHLERLQLKEAEQILAGQDVMREHLKAKLGDTAQAELLQLRNLVVKANVTKTDIAIARSHRTTATQELATVKREQAERREIQQKVDDQTLEIMDVQRLANNIDKLQNQEALSSPQEYEELIKAGYAKESNLGAMIVLPKGARALNHLIQQNESLTAKMEAGFPGPDRRTEEGSELREAVANMTDEELEAAMYRRAVSGLSNRRAMEERMANDEDAQHFAFSDVDTLSWINDNMGHNAGDRTLMAIGEAFLEEDGENGIHVYHISGDEFVMSGRSEADVEAAMKRVRDRISGVKIDSKMDQITPTLTWATGVTVEQADAQNNRMADERAKSGLRTPKGGGKPTSHKDISPKKGVRLQGGGRRQTDPSAGEVEVSVAELRKDIAIIQEAKDELVEKVVQGDKVDAVVFGAVGIALDNAQDKLAKMLESPKPKTQKELVQHLRDSIKSIQGAKDELAAKGKSMPIVDMALEIAQDKLTEQLKKNVQRKLLLQTGEIGTKLPNGRTKYTANEFASLLDQESYDLFTDNLGEEGLAIKSVVVTGTEIHPDTGAIIYSTIDELQNGNKVKGKHIGESADKLFGFFDYQDDMFGAGPALTKTEWSDIRREIQIGDEIEIITPEGKTVSGTVSMVSRKRGRDRVKVFANGYEYTFNPFRNWMIQPNNPNALPDLSPQASVNTAMPGAQPNVVPDVTIGRVGREGEWYADMSGTTAPYQYPGVQWKAPVYKEPVRVRATKKKMRIAELTVRQLFKGQKNLPEITLWASWDDIPTELQEAIIEEGGSPYSTRGWFDHINPARGIHVIVPNAFGVASSRFSGKNISDTRLIQRSIAETVFHEIVGHFGIRGLIGNEKDLRMLMHQLVDSMPTTRKEAMYRKLGLASYNPMTKRSGVPLHPDNDPNRKGWDENTRRNKIQQWESDKQLVGEEYIAYMVGENHEKLTEATPKEKSVIKRIIAWIKEWMVRNDYAKYFNSPTNQILDKARQNEKITDEDVAMLISQAQDFVRYRSEWEFTSLGGDTTSLISKGLNLMRDGDIFQSGLVTAIEYGKSEQLIWRTPKRDHVVRKKADGTPNRAELKRMKKQMPNGEEVTETQSIFPAEATLGEYKQSIQIAVDEGYVSKNEVKVQHIIAFLENLTHADMATYLPRSSRDPWWINKMSPVRERMMTAAKVAEWHDAQIDPDTILPEDKRMSYDEAIKRLLSMEDAVVFVDQSTGEEASFGGLDYDSVTQRQIDDVKNLPSVLRRAIEQAQEKILSETKIDKRTKVPRELLTAYMSGKKTIRISFKTLGNRAAEEAMSARRILGDSDFQQILNIVGHFDGDEWVNEGHIDEEAKANIEADFEATQKSGPDIGYNLSTGEWYDVQPGSTTRQEYLPHQSAMIPDTARNYTVQIFGRGPLYGRDTSHTDHAHHLGMGGPSGGSTVGHMRTFLIKDGDSAAPESPNPDHQGHTWYMGELQGDWFQYVSQAFNSAREQAAGSARIATNFVTLIGRARELSVIFNQKVKVGVEQMLSQELNAEQSEQVYSQMKRFFENWDSTGEGEITAQLAAVPEADRTEVLNQIFKDNPVGKAFRLQLLAQEANKSLKKMRVRLAKLAQETYKPLGSNKNYVSDIRLHEALDSAAMNKYIRNLEAVIKRVITQFDYADRSDQAVEIAEYLNVGMKHFEGWPAEVATQLIAQSAYATYHTRLPSLLPDVQKVFQEVVTEGGLDPKGLDDLSQHFTKTGSRSVVVSPAVLEDVGIKTTGHSGQDPLIFFSSMAQQVVAAGGSPDWDVSVANDTDGNIVISISGPLSDMDAATEFLPKLVQYFIENNYADKWKADEKDRIRKLVHDSEQGAWQDPESIDWETIEEFANFTVADMTNPDSWDELQRWAIKEYGIPTRQEYVDGNIKRTLRRVTAEYRDTIAQKPYSDFTLADGQELSRELVDYTSRIAEDGDNAEAEEWLKQERSDAIDRVVAAAVEKGGELYEREGKSLQKKYDDDPPGLFMGTMPGKIGDPQPGFRHGNIETQVPFFFFKNRPGNYWQLYGGKEEPEYHTEQSNLDNMKSRIAHWMWNHAYHYADPTEFPVIADDGHSAYWRLFPNPFYDSSNVITEDEVPKIDEPDWNAVHAGINDAMGEPTEVEEHGDSQYIFEESLRLNKKLHRGDWIPSLPMSDEDVRALFLKGMISDAVRRGITRLAWSGGLASTKRGGSWDAKWTDVTKLTWTREKMTIRGQEKEVLVLHGTVTGGGYGSSWDEPLVLDASIQSLGTVLGYDERRALLDQVEGKTQPRTGPTVTPQENDLQVSASGMGAFYLTLAGSNDVLYTAATEEAANAKKAELFAEAQAKGGWNDTAGASGIPTSSEFGGELLGAGVLHADEFGLTPMRVLVGQPLNQVNANDGYVPTLDITTSRSIDTYWWYEKGARLSYDQLTYKAWNNVLKEFGTEIEQGSVITNDNDDPFQKLGETEVSHTPPDLVQQHGVIRVERVSGQRQGFVVTGSSDLVLPQVYETQEAANKAMADYIQRNSGQAVRAARVFQITINDAMRAEFAKPQPFLHYDPYEDPILKEAAEQIGSRLPKFRDRLRMFQKTWKDEAHQGIFDKFYGIKYALRKADIYDDLDAENNPYIQARLTTSLDSVMKAVLEYGHPVWEDGITQTKGKGLLEILQPVLGDVETWALYMAGTRSKRLLMEGIDGLSVAELATVDKAAASFEGKTDTDKRLALVAYVTAMEDVNSENKLTREAAKAALAELDPTLKDVTLNRRSMLKGLFAAATASAIPWGTKDKSLINIVKAMTKTGYNAPGRWFVDTKQLVDHIVKEIEEGDYAVPPDDAKWRREIYDRVQRDGSETVIKELDAVRKAVFKTEGDRIAKEFDEFDKKKKKRKTEKKQKDARPLVQKIIDGGRERNWRPYQVRHMSKLGEHFTQFAKVAKDYAEFNKKVLDFAQEAGIINEQTRPMWENADYIPFYRVKDDRMAGALHPSAGIANQQQQIKSLVGGQDNVGDLMHNIMINLTNLVDASMKNHAARMTVDMLQESGIIQKKPMTFEQKLVSMEHIKKKLLERGMNPDAIPKDALAGLQQQFALTPPSGEGVISILRDGKKEFYYTDDDLLYRSMSSINMKQFGSWMNLFRAPKRLLTTLVTLDPGFMGANFIRDTASAFVLSRDNFIPVAGAIKGFGQALVKDEAMRTMLAAGAAFESGYINQYDPNSTKKLLKKAMRKKGFSQTLLTSPRALFEAYKALGSAVENANRMAVYNAAIAAGKGKAQAVFEAKDLMDFSMSGDWPFIQILIQTVPFMGARIQGIHRLGRGMHEHPVAFTMKGMLLMMAGLALWFAFREDERYKELEEWDKDTYFHWWIGEQHYRLPKPFEVGAIFNTIPERIMEYHYSEENDAGKLLLRRFGFMIAETFNMNPTPQTVKPLFEMYYNYNMFQGRQIVSDYEEQRLPTEQYRSSTSPTWIELARLMPEGFDTASKKLRSPLHIQNLYQGYTATLGRYLIIASDAYLRNQMGYAEPPDWRKGDYPVLGRFMRGDEPRRTKYEEEVYTLLRKVTEIQGSMRFFDKTQQYERLEQLEDDWEAYIDIAPDLNDIRQDVQDINKEVMEIWLDQNMDPAEKRKRADRLQGEKNRLFKEGWELRPGGAAGAGARNLTMDDVRYMIDEFGLDGEKEAQIRKTAPDTANLIDSLDDLGNRELERLASIVQEDIGAP